MIDQGFPSIVSSDFNYIDGPEEKREGWLFMEDTGSREFAKFLHSNGMVDLSFVGLRFTLYNNWIGGARVWERIYYVFAMANWI